MKRLLSILLAVSVASCLNWGVEEPSSDGSVDADLDVDEDEDSGGDADVDGDADDDGDTESDVEVDADADEDWEEDPDGDVETDSDIETCEAVCEGRVCGPDGCGETCPPGCDDEQWCYIGECLEFGWTERHPPEPLPTGRSGANMACGPEYCILFGGRTEISSVDETWEWDGVVWTQLEVDPSPPAGTARPLAWDSTRNVFVMYVGSPGGMALEQTWEFDGEAWREVTSDHVPPSRDTRAIAYDSSRNRTVLYGGHTREEYLSDTWEWDGTDWTDTSSSGPGSRGSAALTFDANREVVVLYGACGGSTGTWEWDGRTWERTTALFEPPCDGSIRLAFDSSREVTVLFGGSTDEVPLSYTWERSGTGWYQVEVSEMPEPRSYTAMAYDSARECIVLFGGLTSEDRRLEDTWIYRGAPCIPDCDDDRVCGDDGCGDVFGSGCEADEVCIAEGTECIPRWVDVVAGTFQMGSPDEEVGRGPLSGTYPETQHEVRLSHGFEIRTTEVTQAGFEAVMGYNPSHFSPSGDGEGCDYSRPVENVTWHEAAAYCNALSDEAHEVRCYSCSGERLTVSCVPSAVFADPYLCPGYRLPTEAEWEYAARAGTVAATYNGNLLEGYLTCESPHPVLDEIAWFCGNSDGVTHAVASLRQNPWGLYDMLGNVWEWTHDLAVRDLGSDPDVDPVDGEGAIWSERITRGGCFASDTGGEARYIRAASRGFNRVDLGGCGVGCRSSSLGFRPVRTIF